ncbi:hypothetical protein [Polymorphobacter sp.]|uniref:hypothetical protein n=1 Tax=Polymorphobacter sp. TaxID=1909290 RepID=UPI003F7267A6
MSNGFVLRPILLTAGQVSATATSAINSAFPVANLLDPQPKVVVATTAAGSAPYNLRIDIDFGADVSIDTLAVMFTNLSATATWTVYATPASAGALTETGPNTLVSGAFGQLPQVPGRRRHALWAGTAVNRRRVRIYLVEPSLQSPAVISCGLVLIGKRWEPGDQFRNYDLGAGRAIDDQSIVRTLPGGETHAERAAKVPIWSAVWSGLEHSEMRALWAIIAECGTSEPVLIVEDPDAVAGQNEAMHYGTLTNVQQPFERTQAEKTRVEMRIREML